MVCGCYVPNNVVIQMQLVNQSFHSVMTHHSFSNPNHLIGQLSLMVVQCIMGVHIRYLGNAHEIFELCAVVKA